MHPEKGLEEQVDTGARLPRLANRGIAANENTWGKVRDNGCAPVFDGLDAFLSLYPLDNPFYALYTMQQTERSVCCERRNMTESEARQQVLLAAVKLLGSKGYASMSMNDIVAESGISKGGIYWHFKNKDAIIEAVFVSILDAQLTFIEAQLAGTDPARDKLRRIFGITHLAREESTPPPLEFYAIAARDAALMEQVQRYVHLYQERIAQVIQQGIDSGEFASVDPRMTALNLLSFLEGVVLIGLTVQPETLAAQIDQAVELIFNGLLSKE